jgi:hypothetical protein
MGQFFCEHDDKVIKEHLFFIYVLASAYEQVVVSGKNYTSIPHNPWTFRKKLIMLLKCKKCKRVRKIIEENPT